MTIFIIIGSITVIVLLWTLTTAEESVIHGYPPVRDTQSRIQQEPEVACVEALRPVQTTSLEPYISGRAAPYFHTTVSHGPPTQSRGGPLFLKSRRHE